MAHSKKYILFGARVSEAQRKALLALPDMQELPADFGPFGSGAVHCELFPYALSERQGLSDEALAMRRAEVLADLRGAHVVVVESTGEQPNMDASLERVRSAVDTLHDNGVGTVGVVMANCAYERQDRDFKKTGQVVSVNSKRFAKELKALGADYVVVCTPHSDDVIKLWREQFGKNYYSLQMHKVFADDIRQRFAGSLQVMVGAPDGADKPNDQGQKRARQLCAALHEVESEFADAFMFKIAKHHTAESESELTFFEGNVKARDCVVVDDMIDGGSTMINAARELKKQGARSVTVYATHGICTPKDGVPALERLLAEGNGIDRIVLCDSIPEIHAKREALTPDLQERVSVLSVGPLLAEAVTQQCERARVNSYAAAMNGGAVRQK